MKKVTNELLKEMEPVVRSLLEGGEANVALMEMWTRYGELLVENRDQKKAVAAHTVPKVFPIIAAYETLLAHGIDRDTAGRQVYFMFLHHVEKAAARLKGLMRVPFATKAILPVMRKGIKTRFGEDAGFTQKWYETEKNVLKVDILTCPYYETCKRYGCPEMTQCFCDSDDLCYGNIHERVLWGRTKTLGKGGDCCDFMLTVVPRGGQKALTEAAPEAQGKPGQTATAEAVPVAEQVTAEQVTEAAPETVEAPAGDAAPEAEAAEEPAEDAAQA